MEVTSKIEEICWRMANVYKNQLSDDNAYATGTLMRSVDNWTVETGETYFELWFNLPEYYKYSPEGTYEPKSSSYADAHPSRAMIESIESWIAAKNLDLNAWAVAKTIMTDGWKREPRKNLQKALESIEMENLEDELIDEIAGQEEDIIGKMLEDI